MDLLEKVVRFRQDASKCVKELQAADFVEWALFLKYEWGNDHFH